MKNSIRTTDTECPMKNSPPLVLFDPDTKAEFLMEKTPLHYVACTDGEWFICERDTDTVVPGTLTKSRAETVRKFYDSVGRPMPEGWRVPNPVNGTNHNGIG